MNSIRTGSTLTVLVGLPAIASAQYQVSLDPKNTYLHTNQDNAGDTVPVDLAALSITPGMHLRITVQGDFDNGTGTDDSQHLLGIFSATSTLLGADNLDRVADAIDAGFDFQTTPTYFGSEPTDVAEDFLVSYAYRSDLTVTVPAGAAYLFLACPDTLYLDNSDPDGDFGALIDVISAGSFVDLGDGLAGVNGVPTLTGSGTLIAADPLDVTLSSARANSLSFLVLGFARWDAPFKGGTFVPSADFILVLPTDSTGGFQIQTLFPEGAPQDLHFFLQWWIVDPSAVKGMSASNALEGITP
jgi:hypothetical protein